ncbi:MAG TPA: hypothetical protein VGN20_22925 [Mucilaginibacter sp.]|jgi:tellurite resistance protein
MATTTPENQTFLEFFPLTLFASVSTLSSLSYAWGFTGTDTGLWIKQVLAIAAISLFVLFSVIYLLKWFKYPELVAKEFNDPVAVNLFGVFFISLLLISGLLRAYNIQLALVLWSVSTLLNFLFSYMVITRWITQQQNPQHALPVWAIPVLGLLDIPLTGYPFQYAVVHEICLIFLAAGILFTLIVVTMIFQRLVFQEGIAATLQPTLLLLSAPFALLFADYEQITGRQDLVAVLLFYMSIVLLILFGRKLLGCLTHLQFTITWWSISFPLAAAVP